MDKKDLILDISFRWSFSNYCEVLNALSNCDLDKGAREKVLEWNRIDDSDDILIPSVAYELEQDIARFIYDNLIQLQNANATNPVNLLDFSIEWFKNEIERYDDIVELQYDEAVELFWQLISIDANGKISELGKNLIFTVQTEFLLHSVFVAL